MKPLTMFALIPLLALGACAVRSPGPDADRAMQGAFGSPSPQFSRDRAYCDQSARQAAAARQQQLAGPVLTPISDFGVGVAVWAAQARALRALRDQAYHDCMLTAGWGRSAAPVLRTARAD